MKSKTLPQFWQAFDKLPVSIQKLAQKQFQIWNANNQHPSLNFKRVGKNPPIYSARITHTYRALAYVKGDTSYWFWIGHHSQYERLISS